MFPSDFPVFEPIRNMLAETVTQINNAVAHRNDASRMMACFGCHVRDALAFNY